MRKQTRGRRQEGGGDGGLRDEDDDLNGQPVLFNVGRQKKRSTEGGYSNGHCRKKLRSARSLCGETGGVGVVPRAINLGVNQKESLVGKKGTEKNWGGGGSMGCGCRKGRKGLGEDSGGAKKTDSREGREITFGTRVEKGVSVVTAGG